MACVVGPALAPLMPPIITAGFVSVLLTKSLFFPLAWFAIFWHLVTYLAFYFDGTATLRAEFHTWPIGIFAVAAAVGCFLSQLGAFPRLFNFAHVLRTYQEAAAQIYDRRRTVWEGLVLVLSFLAIYLGFLFVLGSFSDPCPLVDFDTAVVLGWILLIAGIIGVLVLVLVTLFSVHAHNIERMRMWKYVIAGLVGIVAHALLHMLLYALVPSIGIWYGIIGLIPLVVFWVGLFWWIRDVHFYDEMRARAGFKALGDREEAVSVFVRLDTMDGFEIESSLTAFVVAGGLYNVVTVVAAWLVAHFTLSLLWTFITVVIASAVAAIIIILVAFLTPAFGVQQSVGVAAEARRL